ncbi:MAG TPA: hypothetical protein PKE64_19420 [Anaerolineae bacterium]|nr:hypothetical protein [Anaerolineae bacterium]HMR66187.1 hypothetical protein [Anaerolineae bacterium]
MEIVVFLQTLAYVPTLASRPFLTAFVIALLPQLLLQFPTLYDNFSSSVLAPLWFSQPLILVTLGILALVEILPFRKLNLRTWLNESGPPLKAGMALLITFALIDSVSTAPLRGLIVNSDLADLRLGSGYNSTVGFAWSLIICTVTWIIAVIQPDLLPSASLLFSNRLTHLLSKILVGLEAGGTILLVVLATVSPLAALVVFAVIEIAQAVLRQYRKTHPFGPALPEPK